MCLTSFVGTVPTTGFPFANRIPCPNKNRYANAFRNNTSFSVNSLTAGASLRFTIMHSSSPKRFSRTAVRSALGREVIRGSSNGNLSVMALVSTDDEAPKPTNSLNCDADSSSAVGWSTPPTTAFSFTPSGIANSGDCGPFIALSSALDNDEGGDPVLKESRDGPLVGPRALATSLPIR